MVFRCPNIQAYYNEAVLCLNYILAFLNWGEFLKRICSIWSKFFPLRDDTSLEELYGPDKQIGSHTSCFPLYK